MAEKINVPIVTSYDDKGAKKAIKDAEKIDDLKPEIEITADDKATPDLKAVQEQAEALDKADAEIVLRAKVDAAKGDLTALQQQLADLDGKTSTVKIDSTSAKQGLDDIGKSADSSKSVLANMVGNATQDIGALGGIAGSAGVAIGQIGEYAADAAFGGEKLTSVLKNMALVAGPVALLATAISVVSGLMAEQAAAAKASEERTKKFGEAMEGAADDSIGLAESLRNNIELLTNFDAQAQGFGGNLQEYFASIGRNVPLIGGLIGDAGKSITDVTGIMDKAGLSIYDVARAIERGGEVGDDWSRTLEEAAAAGKITNDEYSALFQVITKYGIETTKANEAQKIFNVSADEANAILKELTAQSAPLEQFTSKWKTLLDDMKDGAIDTEASAEAINFLADALGLTETEVIALAQAEQKRRDGIKQSLGPMSAYDAGQKAINEQIEEAQQNLPSLIELQEKSAQAHRDTADAILELIDAQRSAADATFALHDAEAAFAEEQAGLNEKLKEAKSLYETRSILEDYAQSAQAVADGVVRIAEEQGKVAGKVVTATHKIDLQNDSLLASAASMDGPARTAIVDHIARLNGIPQDIATYIAALIDQGKIDEADRLLDETSATRTAAIKADAETGQAETELNHLARDRYTLIRPQVGQVVRSAAGSGNFGGGDTWVGEDGPEIVRLPAGSQIFPAPTSFAMAHNGNGGGGGGAVNVTINMPKGSRGVDVLRQVTNQARRSGRRYGTPVVHYARRP